MNQQLTNDVADAWMAKLRFQWNTPASFQYRSRLTGKGTSPRQMLLKAIAIKGQGVDRIGDINPNKRPLIDDAINSLRLVRDFDKNRQKFRDFLDIAYL